MLNCYNSSAQSVAVDGVLVYDTDQFNRGVATSHTAGSGTFTLNRPGVYLVKFNGVAAAQETADDAVVTAQLYKNGSEVTNAFGSETSGGATDVVNIGFETLVEVLPYCPFTSTNNGIVSLTVQNTGVAATYSLANIVVIKVR